MPHLNQYPGGHSILLLSLQRVPSTSSCVYGPLVPLSHRSSLLSACDFFRAAVVVGVDASLIFTWFLKAKPWC